MAIVTIPDITKYHLPKMILKKVEILNSSSANMKLVIDYDFQYDLKPGLSATSTLINKYIKPIVVAMPTIDLALLYENYIKNYSDVIASGTGKYMLPFVMYQSNDRSNPIGTSLNGYSHSFLNMRENKRLLATSMINSHYAISDNIAGTPNQGYAVTSYDEIITVTDKYYYNPLRTRHDNVLKKVYLDISYNGRVISRKRDSSSNNVDIYLYYFSWLDFYGLLTDDNFNQNDLLALDSVRYEESPFYDGSKRNYFHGQIGKDLILSGEFDWQSRNFGIKVPEDGQLLLRQDGSLPSGMRVVRYNGIYYGTTDYTSTEYGVRSRAKTNPQELERLVARKVPNIKVVDKRQIARLSANERYNNMSYNYTLDAYSNASVHRSELEILANKISQTTPSVQQSVTNMEKLISRSESLEAKVDQQTTGLFSQTNITEEEIEHRLQHNILKNKKRYNSRGNFKTSVITTPDFGNGTVEFMAIFDQEEIVKRNSIVMGFLDTKNYITRFNNEQLNVERLQIMAPREKLRILSAKVLRKKVSKTYDKINQFGCYAGRSQLGDEGLYSKNGAEVVCEAHGPTPRTMDESIKFLSNASYEDMYSESQTLIPTVNTEGSLIDMSSLLISSDLAPSLRPPKRAAFIIKDRSIMNKLEGTYQYGMELTYQDPADKLIDETLYKANVLVFCLQKILDHINNPSSHPALIRRVVSKPFQNSALQAETFRPYHDIFSIFYCIIP